MTGHDEGRPTETRNGSTTLTVLLVFCAPVAVLAAIALEVASGERAASPAAGAGPWVPLSWPPPLRALYWLVLGMLAVGHRAGLSRIGLSPRRLVTAATALPFAMFAFGAAVQAPWAAWH